MIALIAARNAYKYLLLLAFLFIVVPSAALAQGEGSISGTVSDTTGGALPGASVTVKSLETGAVRSLTVGDNGRYDAPLLPIGQYEVTAELPGFQPSKKQVTLVVGARLAIDMTLNTGVVNVTGERAGGVGTSASAVGNMFSVSGHRPQENLYLLNGIEYSGSSNINTTPGGASGQLLGVDAIREFEVVKDTYGA